VSYTKQMMEAAQEWLRVNPDPKSPFLRIPGLDKNRETARAEVITDAERRRYDTLVKRRPEIATFVEQLKDLDRQVATERDLLHQHEVDLEKIISSPSPGQDKHVVSQNLIGRWCLAWARSGYNLFDLSPDFVAAMLLTDARELDVDLVRLPFPAMLIMMPDGFAIGAEGRSYTKIHVTEISGNDLRVLHAGDRVWDALSALPLEEARETLEELMSPTRRSASLLDQVGTPLVGPSTSLRPSALGGALHIYATDGVNVLDTLIDREGLSWDAFDDLSDGVTDDADKSARQTLRQIVFGMLAYANAIDRSVEPRFPEPRRPASADKPRAAQWTIGRTIRIDPMLVQLARGGNREAMFRLKHRFIVRGHYRNQAHGPQRTLRTSRWITPHWKGPTEGATLVHTYKLDGTGDKTC
jgi:hypothetical protein